MTSPSHEEKTHPKRCASDGLVCVASIIEPGLDPACAYFTPFELMIASDTFPGVSA
jgi:hypothetical protein